MQIFSRVLRFLTFGIVLLVVVTAFAAERVDQPRWWKGNLHTHSLWSDGDDYPEMIVEWYKTNGYHFLALSDHNILLKGEKWISLTNNKGGEVAFQKYVARFGKPWVEQRTLQNTQQVRLQPLDRFRPLFEETDRFLLIPSQEISDRHRLLPVHINVANIRDRIPPQGGTNVLDVMQRNLDAVLAQRKSTGQPMFPHINHPNFGWGITAEELMRVQGEQFFEVYNGHPSVRNEGDAYHASTERIWDIILTFRLTELGLGPLYGLGVDDSHHYHAFDRTNSNSGRGWVMVRAARLDTASIIAAMEAGDFYASSGVRLADIMRKPKRLSLRIEREKGVTYTTQFIGTRRGFDPASQPGERPPNSIYPVTRRYSEEIGAVLAEVKGVSPSYTFKGDELYVRAKVISSKPKANPYAVGEVETAWTQPVVLK